MVKLNNHGASNGQRDQQSKTKIHNNYKGDIVWDGIRLRKAVGRPVGRL